MEERNYWQRAMDRRVGRRSALRGAAVGMSGLAGAALIGCGGEDEEPEDGGNGNGTPPAGGTTPAGETTSTPAQSGSAQRGGMYRGGFTGPFAGVDPHNSVYGGSGIVPQVYNYLFRAEPALNPDVETRYDLAVSHELEDDELTWVFKLRTDAMIAPNSQGVPERALDSEDVLRSWDRIADPAAGSNGFIFFNRWVDTYDAPDAETVRLVTTSPYAWVDDEIGDALKGAIVPREWLEQGDAIKAGAVGAGPFILNELTEGQRAIMVRNPNFYDSELPYLDEYHILAFADIATQRAAFTTRQLDVFSSQDIEEARAVEQEVENVLRYEDASTGYKSFWMRTDVAPWDDERVRRAVRWAINDEQYIQIIGKGQGEQIGPVTYAFGAYALPAEELTELSGHRPDEAAKLFQAAGVTELVFQHPTSSNTNDFVNIFQQQLQQIGITGRPEPQDAGTWVAGYFTSQLTASLSLNQSYKTPDAALQWYHTGGITGNNNYDTKFADPEVDAAIDDAAGLLDEEARIEAYHEAQRLIYSKDPAFINFYGQYSNPLIYDDVMNYHHGPGVIDSSFIREYWIDA